MISRKELNAMSSFVEKSKTDKARDKKKGVKEGSKADMKLDNNQAKRLLVRGNKNQQPPKGWK